jgi:two-component system phosphate regulon sensor histidine kinase PhoR
VIGFWWKPLLTLGAAALLATVLGLIFGPLAAVSLFCLSLLVLYLVQLWNLRALDRWLRKPEEESLPDGVGLWEEVFANLYRLLKLQSRSQQQLVSALERLQNAARAIPDGVVVLNGQDQIDWCNPVAERHFDLDLARDRGRQIIYLMRQPAFVAYLAAHSHSEPLVMKCPRNRDNTLSVQLVPFGNDQKLLISRDITQLERVETMRRDFIANVSHELRTPLTVVGGFLETMIDVGEMDEEQRRDYFRLMQDQTRRMQRLVEDLLTLSRLEGPQTTLAEEHVDMPRLMQLLHSDAVSLSGGRHRVTLEAVAPQGLTGSESELHSAFGNLISNAIRYTPEGGEIALRWEMRNGEGVFSVRDTGEGIEHQHIPRLTERFYRVDRSRSRETGGTGLGLSIVKHVLTRHQGKLEIDSEPGKGSTFRAVLPARRLTAAS